MIGGWATSGPVRPLPARSGANFWNIPFDFPSGPNYVVGQSRWTTDWNFCQPMVVTGSGGMTSPPPPPSPLIWPRRRPAAPRPRFIWPSPPITTAPLVVSVNGSNLGSGTAASRLHPAVKARAVTIHPGAAQTPPCARAISADMSDERLTFPGSLLRAGQNTITIKCAMAVRRKPRDV